MIRFCRNQMTPLIRTLTIFCVFSATTSYSESNTKKKLHINFQQATSNAAQSIHVIRVADGKELFAENSSTKLIPASVSKLVASAALLAHFGPTHRFCTKFYHTGTLSGGVISGDFVIVGDGDPLFTSEDLWQIAVDLKNRGITAIKGDIVIDDSLFTADEAARANASTHEFTTNAYDAPVSAFAVNFNTVAVSVSPGASTKSPAVVHLDPYPLHAVHLENKATTGTRTAKNTVHVTRASLPDGSSKLIVTGVVPLETAQKKFYRSINSPILHAGEYTRAFLSQHRINVSGKTRTGRLPDGAHLLIAHDGKDLAQIIRDLMYYSNNYIADVLVNRLGAAFPVKPGTTKAPNAWQRGLGQINRFIEHELSWRGDYAFVSGSGLSKENRLSAVHLTSLLRRVSQHWRYFPEFLASLPIAGQSGNLKSRFGESATVSLRGRVRAKTGTFIHPLTVSSLAGYVEHPHEGVLAFAIIQNGYSGKKQPSLPELHANEERGLAELLHTPFNLSE